MKRLVILIIVIAGIFLIVPGCKKDKQKGSTPVITLLGVSPVNAGFGYPYIDAGATASDIEDGDITAKIVTANKVNTAKAGIYYVNYIVTDKMVIMPYR